MHRANIKFHHGQPHRQQHKGDCDGHPVAAGMKIPLAPVQHKACGQAQQHREQNFHHRLHHHGQHTDGAAFQRHGHAKGGRKQHQTHRVVDGHHHEQQPGERAVRFVLAHHHQRGGGGGGCCDGAQRDGGGHRQRLRRGKMQRHQHQVHHHRGEHRLHDAHRHRLFAHGFQVMDAELVADGEGDESQRHIRNDVEKLHLFQTVEAQPHHAEPPHAERPQQQSGDQIRRDGGQIHQLGQPVHHQPGNEGNGHTKQLFLHTTLLLVWPATGPLQRFAASCQIVQPAPGFVKFSPAKVFTDFPPLFVAFMLYY